MPQNTPEGRGQQSHNAADYIQTEAGFVKKPKSVEGQATDRVQAVEKKLKPLATTVAMKDVRPFWPTQEELAQAGEAISASTQSLVDKAKQLQPLLSPGVNINPNMIAASASALTAALNTLRAEPTLKEKPTKELVDSLVTIGTTSKNVGIDNAELRELRALVIEMQAKLAAQPAAAPAGMPNIVINNNLAPQNGPQAPAQAVEKKVEQQGWQEEGRTLMYQVASINQRITLIRQEYDQQMKGGTLDPVAKKAMNDEVDSLISQRKQLLRTVNSVIESARKPSEDRNQIAATQEETVLAMNRWLNDMGQNRRGLTVFQGQYKVM